MFFSSLFYTLVILVSWYYMSPIFILVGAAGLLINLLALIFRWSNDTDRWFIGCGPCVLLLLVLFGIQFFLPSGRCLVSGWHDQRHIYRDCCNKKNPEKDYKVCFLSAYMMYCTDNCKFCIDRRKEEKEKARKEYQLRLEQLRAQQHIEDINTVKEQIKELQEVLDSLEAGVEVDIEEYAFRYVCEEDIREEAYEYVRENQDEFFERREYDPADYY